MPLPHTEILARARQIRLLLLDCDGVLTDGSLHYAATETAAHASETTKVFHIHDGQGLRLAQAVGLPYGLISGRNSAAVTTRTRELGFTYVFQGIADKRATYEQIRQAAGLTDAEIAYIGDDLPDLPLLRRVGLAVAVADAVPEVRAQAHCITQKPGGRGAVREVIELLLQAQNRWEDALRPFLQ